MKLTSRGLIGVIIASAVLMTAGDVCAQQAVSDRSTAPWYERFTFGSEFKSNANAWTPRGETKATIKVSPKSKWGVTFGMEVQPTHPNDFNKGQTSAGAFYDFTKNFRIGGQVVVPEPQFNAADPNKKKKNSPGVKVESAFRF